LQKLNWFAKKWRLLSDPIFTCQHFLQWVSSDKDGKEFFFFFCCKINPKHSWAFTREVILLGRGKAASIILAKIFLFLVFKLSQNWILGYSVFKLVSFYLCFCFVCRCVLVFFLSLVTWLGNCRTSWSTKGEFVNNRSK
jgi:hypothetical protein